MPTLNPFIRALFQSSVLSQALAAQNYVLLVPTTESLVYAKDADLNKTYSELCSDEDFLGSHILRITPPDASASAKDGTIKESRGKAKTYSTVNGRTVIIKETMVYSNKGFKHLSQAQLLSDSLYYSPGVDAQQWLIVYISKPLAGTYEKINLTLPVTGAASVADAATTAQASSTNAQPLQPKKKDIQTFNDLLTHFPMIARQMQPGLERLFNEFGKELGRPLPPPPSRSPTQLSLDGTTQVSDDTSINSNGTIKMPFGSAQFLDDDEDLMRTALETAVTAAIDLFQGVDKQQLSFLGATTDLTGPAVERLIERYVAESVHDSLLFPRLCALHRAADHDLDRRIRQMDCLDVAQVGIALEQGRDGKRELLSRISRGVTAFRKMGVAGSPQQMLDILLETQKVVSEPTGISDQEKRAAAMTINADILVSLLLVVVIRSQVRHLQARLTYMQRFIYIDDVESGEIGYALSTLEAVLAYLATDSGGLRKASKQNQLLWNAVKAGDIPMMRDIYQGMSAALVIDDPEPPSSMRPPLSRTSTKSSLRSSLSIEVLPEGIDQIPVSNGNLSHVFPFQANGDIKPSDKKSKKRVKMEARSMSISSSTSMLSRTATLESTLSGLEGDTSIESLAQTQDATGNSIAMMAIEAQKPESLRFLLSMSEHYPPEIIMDDTTSEGATLLSAAIQLSNAELIALLLDYAESQTDPMSLKLYLAKQDSRGRSACHYLFNTPYLITKLADKIPWRLKDKIGQTPLFSICRSYDHSNYHTMVSDALVAAKNGQGDHRALNLEDHTDNKANTLLHILNDPIIMHRVLHHCDTNPNAMNDRKFTPLMLASKYGRVDMVRIFFGDPRIDLYLREARGLTAVELAKDDEVRNRIDDLTLFSETATSVSPDSTGRLTAIVRSFFVEDGTTRYILKSGAPQSPTANTTYTITTSRRSLQDFSNLAKWLAIDHPSSYLPNLDPLTFRTPFQIHSRPSKAVLHDSQTQLDRFLKILITHPTFANHEVLWEFFLVPEMQPDTVEARTRLKAEVLKESIADDYEPLTAPADLADIESVIAHSRDIVKRVSISTRTNIRRGHVLAQELADIAESTALASTILVTLGPPSTSLPKSHTKAFASYAALLHSEPASSPLNAYLAALHSFIYTLTGIQTALSRPLALISQIRSAQRSLEKYRSALSSQATPRKGLGPFNISIPGMEESRQRGLRETEQRIVETEIEIEEKGKSLRYGQEVVLAELAGWTSWRERWGRDEIKRFARGVVVRERERLRGMQRVLERLGKENESNAS